MIKEVCLYFEYKLYRANRTTKINAEHFQAFSSPNFPPLAESGVHLKFNNRLLFKNSDGDELITRKKFDNNISILKLFPGITKNVIESVFAIKGLKGLVLETYGSGNAPSEKWFIELMKKAIEDGLHIVNVTQCAGGRVLMGQYETSVELERIGVISGNDITTESAIAKLMYLLGQNISKNEFKTIFEMPLRGEMEVKDLSFSK